MAPAGVGEGADAGLAATCAEVGVEGADAATCVEIGAEGADDHVVDVITLGWYPSLQAALLALLKYPFYLLFILDNGMNLLSKSLTILTPA